MYQKCSKYTHLVYHYNGSAQYICGYNKLEAVTYIYIVACNLSKGSYFRWREDMSGGLTSVVLIPKTY